MHPFILIIFLFFNNVACTKVTKTEEKIAASEEQTEEAKPEVPKKNEQEPPTSSKELAWAQQNLDLLGYEPGNIDGQLTPKTQAALSAFQIKFKLPITGKLDDSTYQVLEREVERKKRESQKQHPETVDSPPHKQSVTVQPKPKETPEVVKPQNKHKHTIKTRKKNTPPARVYTDIQTLGVHLVAASLAEIGYFQSPLKQAKLKMVETALKSFQKDIGVTPTGVLDDVTLKKLQNIKLSSARQAELDAVSSPPAKKKTIVPA
ncbi:Peptidoglycan binding-like domain protein, partial [Candidatus Thiomargarita nelsonii]